MSSQILFCQFVPGLVHCLTSVLVSVPAADLESNELNITVLLIAHIWLSNEYRCIDAVEFD